MSARITLPKITPGRTHHAHGGVVVADQVAGHAPPADAPAQPDRPLPTAKIATPITPRAVREALLGSISEFAEDQQADLMLRNLTILDRMLTSEQAAALEQYATDEENFDKAGISRYDPEIIDTSPVNRAHIDGERHEALSRHLWVRGKLLLRECEILRTWCLQMNSPKEAMSAHQAGAHHLLANFQVGSVSQMNTARDHWHKEIVKMGETLRLLYAAYAKIQQRKKAAQSAEQPIAQ